MFVHRALTARNSDIEKRIQGEIKAILKMEGNTMELNLLNMDIDFACLHDPTGLPSEAVERTVWKGYMFKKPITLDSIVDIPSTYFAHAPEVCRVAKRKKETFTFMNTQS